VNHPRLFFMIGSRVWTQGSTPARQMLYRLSHVSSPFCCGYFWDKSLTFCLGGPGLRTPYFRFHAFTGMTHAHHHARPAFFWDGGVSQTFWSGWPRTSILPILSSPGSLDYWHKLPVPSQKILFFGGTGAWTQGHTLNHSTSHIFVMSFFFFKIESLKLFARAGFKPQSYWSLLPE
jgi:hypothetical protein